MRTPVKHPAQPHVPLSLILGTSDHTFRTSCSRASAICVVFASDGKSEGSVARCKLEHFPVDVLTSTFEDWPLPTDPFDLVIAATSFHWVDPPVRVTKSADALRLGGALATITTRHVAGGS